MIRSVWMVFLLFFVLQGQAFGHASLIESYPADGSRLVEVPEAITLTFNERLERHAYNIAVLDKRGESVTSNTATISEDQRQVSLKLPWLADGLYTVTYSVISADGHPVTGSYIITIGQDLSMNPGNAFDPHANHAGHGSHMRVDLFASRIIYYGTLLFFAGWSIWSTILRKQQADLRQFQSRGTIRLLSLYLLASIVTGALQFREMIANMGIDELLTVFTRTNVGISWLLSTALAVVGLVLLTRWRWLDALWIALLLATIGISGHAAAIEPPWRTITLNVIHLYAAALWVGGVLYLIVLRRKYPEKASSFIVIFSRLALLSMIVLVVTGVLSTVLFLPNLNYLLLSGWGRMLIAKVALVLAAIVTGALIRSRLKRAGQLPIGLIRVDFTLMLCIVGIVGVFTYLTPAPSNVPLNWHEMGETIHMTAKINPGKPSIPNEYVVQVWLPDHMTEPKKVQLLLKNKSRTGMGAIEVPLAKGTESQLDPLYFPGFTQYVYSAEGPYIPFPGKWEVNVRVMDPLDDESMFSKEITIY